MNKANPPPVARSFCSNHPSHDKQQLCERGHESSLTFLVGREKDAEATFAARLVCPHADDAQRGNQHDVVGHRGAELALQVFHRTEMRQG